MYNQTDIKGMQCAVLRRSSSNGQGTSISNQGRTVDHVIAEHHLHVVKEYILQGVTGSIPGNRSDIDDVIEERKKLGNVRLLLLVPDHTRFTRAGAGHGGHLLYRLRANGILVYFVAEDLLVDSDLTLQMALMLLAAAHQTAKSIARSSTIGTDISFLKGKSPYTRRPPLGLDRMYFSDGEPLHIIRNLPDGTQEMLDPHTRAFIRRFGKNAKSGVPAHYIKQKNETVALCPGAEAEMAKVFLLFEMRYAQLLKFRQIALRLNADNVRSPSGVEWSAASVQKILLNPIYVGLAIRYRTTKGIYVQGGSPGGEPEPSDVTPQELDQLARIRPRRRKRDKWNETSINAFEEFLPAHVRDAAKRAILHHLDQIADGKPLKEINRDPHTNSLYLLKNIMHCKQTSFPMTGRLSGKKDHQVRKYGISKGTHIPRHNGPSTALVHAEPIEAAVMNFVRQVVLDRPGMVDAMRKVLVRTQGQQQTQPNDIAGIQKQIKKLRKQIALLSDQVQDDDETEEAQPNSDDPIVLKIQQAKQEIARLTASIREMGATPSAAVVDPQDSIERLADELQAFGRKIVPSDIPLISAVLKLLVNRLEVDRDTKEFELELSIPSWLGNVLNRPLPAGLDSLIGCKPRIEAHPENPEILGIYRCNLDSKPKCYECRRAA